MTVTGFPIRVASALCKLDIVSRALPAGLDSLGKFASARVASSFRLSGYIPE